MKQKSSEPPVYKPPVKEGIDWVKHDLDIWEVNRLDLGIGVLEEKKKLSKKT